VPNGVRRATRKVLHVLFAEDQPTDGGFAGGLLGYLPIILIIVAFYFLLIRPNNKRRREQQELQSRVGPGDEIRTIGGLFGTVVSTDDESVTIEAAPGVELRFAREAIGRVIKKVDEPDEEEEAGEEPEADDSTRRTDRE
jgi:preprotein translocase subunit YajC